MTVVLLESILALAPAVLLLWIIYHADTADKEPMSLIAKAFFLGVIICIPVALCEAVVGGIIDSFALAQTGLLYVIVSNLFGVALIEEGGKMLAAYWTAWKKPAFNYVFDGIVYAGAAALGFAAFENLLYIVGSSDAWGIGVARALLSVPGHLCDGVFMGLFLGYAKRAMIQGDQGKKRLYFAGALLAPITEHMIYDSICSLDSDASFVLLLGFVAIVYLLAIVIVMKNRGKNDQKFLDDQAAEVKRLLGHSVGTFDQPQNMSYGYPQGQVYDPRMGQPYGAWPQNPGAQPYQAQPYGGVQSQPYGWPVAQPVNPAAPQPQQMPPARPVPHQVPQQAQPSGQQWQQPQSQQYPPYQGQGYQRPQGASQVYVPPIYDGANQGYNPYGAQQNPSGSSQGRTPAQGNAPYGNPRQPRQ